MNARNRSYHAPSFPSPAGVGTRPLFKKCRNDEGRYCLRKVGETDQQALIDSFKDECDVNRIVQKCANGDFSALARVQGLYTDISGMPDNPTDAFNLGNMVRDLTPEQIAALEQSVTESAAESENKNTTEEVNNNVDA